MTLVEDREKHQTVVDYLRQQFPNCAIAVVISDQDSVLHFGYACLACTRETLAYVSNRLRHAPHTHDGNGDGENGGNGDGGSGKGAVM